MKGGHLKGDADGKKEPARRVSWWGWGGKRTGQAKEKRSRRSMVGPSLSYLGSRRKTKLLYHRGKKSDITDNI